MDGIPVQILNIERNEEAQKSVYNFRYDALHDILDDVKDIEVAVISIAGPSRQGKSFLLSYLLRYLSNPNDNNWIGNNEDPLLGFKWNHGIEPETKGIWIWSKPIVVEHSGNKKAILILDSQGVYDEYTDIRDWSTIVGITLLTSSCFIFNVFTDIQENVLTQLETFVNYGLLAISKDTSNRPAFQRLLFLIRDWNHARVFNYGHSGGKEYITQKLMIKTNQPQASQRTRQLIRKCFEDVNCYLMPEPGRERENPGFSGSVAQLSDRFVAKLKELFSVLLTPDSLKPKVINGNAINGRDLLKFFEVFVEKFNGDELPQPIDLVEAVAKATDLNLIYRLKERYVSDMNTELQNVHFLSSYELKVLHDSVLKNILEIFKNSRKSQNYEVVKQINIIFETEIRNTYKRIHFENEEKKDKIAKNTIETSLNIYTENMLSYMKDKCFIKSANFDEYSNKSKQMAKNNFTQVFGETSDEIDAYAPYLLKIYKLIEEKEYSLKSENHRLKFETKQINLNAIKESFDNYCERMKSILDEKVFIANEMFIQYEKEVRAEALHFFANKSQGYEDLIQKSEELLRLRLNDAKAEFESMNRNIMKDIINTTNIVLDSALNICKEKIAQTLDNFCGNEDVDQINAFIKEYTIKTFIEKCFFKDTNFLNPYIKKLEEEIDKTLIEMNKEFEIKVKQLYDFYDKTVDEAMDRCFLDRKTFFDEKSLQTEEESVHFREQLINDVIETFKNDENRKQEKFDEIKVYVNERTASTADLLLIDKLIEYYSGKMGQILATKNFFSRESLSLVHNENSGHVINTFDKRKKTDNLQLLNELFAKLNDKLEAVFVEFHSQNEHKREALVREAIDMSLHLYKQSMSQVLDNVCVESLRFEEINNESKAKALNNLMDVCDEEKELIAFYCAELSKLIEKSENEFNIENSKRLSEAKKNNSEAVSESIDYYSGQMNFALNQNLFHSNESFKQYENRIRDESLEMLHKNCKYGEIEFINKFELDFEIKIKALKNKFKSNFRQYLESMESEIIVKMNDALTQYNDVMYLLLDAIKSEQQFNSKHEEVKQNVINGFKQKCKINDNQYRDEQISKLIEAIDESRNEFLERLTNQMKRSGNFYEKTVNELFITYSQLMKDLFSDDSSITEEELFNLHQNIVKEIMTKFDIEFEDESDSSVVESNRKLLEVKIINEFNEIKRNNRSRVESNERSDMRLKLEINDYLKEYEERMEKMIPFCGDENELSEQHLSIESIIKDQMTARNPGLSAETLEPYLTQLEVEINKSFNDFNVIFRVNLDKQLLTLQKVVMNARKFYREEFDKHYKNTNFLRPEKLIKINQSVIDRTIAKYQSERENMSIEKFSNHIKDSLIDIFDSIAEENDKNTPTLPAIGIDLGTTNSCVAYFQPSKPRGRTIIVPNDLGANTTPSVVAFGDNNEEVIGEAAKEQSYFNARNTIYSAKRLIGRQFTDENIQYDMKFWPFKVVDDGNNIAKISVKVDGSDKTFFPEEISAKILRKLKTTAENHLGCEVKNAVITVPAYFNDAQKESTKDAGKIAGLNVLKIINEPTASAIAFQLNRSDELGSRNVLIYDFGGGTFDVVVLNIEKGVIDIKAVGGDNHLGGDDIDAILVEYTLNDFIQETHLIFDRESEEGENALRRLTTECEKRKRQLCATNSVVVKVDHFYDGNDLRCELTREKFEELNNDLFVKSMDLVAQVLVDSNLETADIDDVVLVGGTTRIPKVQEKLSDLFYGKPLNHSVNPDEAVAVGAAIQAAILNGTVAQTAGLLKVSDVTPMSLGVKVKDGFMSVIIHRNSKVPNKYTKQYETTSDNQTEVDIEIYEGEETMALDNRKLGTFTLSNIPPSPAGEQQIEVNFNINDEGILHVNAKIISSGEEEEILITEHKGRLTNAELQQLIEQEN